MSNIIFRSFNVFFFLFSSVFWDLYCAAPERRDTCDHSSEAKAFHDYVSWTRNISFEYRIINQARTLPNSNARKKLDRVDSLNSAKLWSHLELCLCRLWLLYHVWNGPYFFLQHMRLYLSNVVTWQLETATRAIFLIRWNLRCKKKRRIYITCYR